MTFKPNYWHDPLKLKFKSQVKKVDGDKVILSNTYFHPEGGGQPSDKGTINGCNVVDVQKEEGEIVHYIPDNNFETNDEVECEIDEEFRLYCMRAHTGSHIVFGAGKRILGDINYSGFEISKDKVRIDFETDSKIDRDKLLQMEEMANKIILESRPISWELKNRAELKNMEDLAYAKGLPDEEKVRVVEIKDWDKASCSGTHFSNTIFIGRINVIGKKKLQEGVTRVEFKVGIQALEEDQKEKRTLFNAEKVLESNKDLLISNIREIRLKNKELEKELELKNQELLKYEFQNLDLYESDNYDLLTGIVSFDNSEKLSHMVKDHTDVGEIVLLINNTSSISVFISVGKGVKDIKANEVIKELCNEFGGGGGGSDEFAQGGGFTENPDNILIFVKKLLL